MARRRTDRRMSIENRQEYVPLTDELYEEISEGRCRF
jgi:hypothetical protein